MARIIRVELAQELANSHKQLMGELKDMIAADGGCDHSVGVCWCRLIHMLEDAEAVQVKIKEALK